MEMGIQGKKEKSEIPSHIIKLQQNKAIKEVAKKAAQEQMSVSKPVSKEEIAKHIRRTLKDSSLLNRDLRYSINTETDQITVKIVDRNTNKVIKEIPSESIQRLQVSLKKYIGLLVDEQI